MILWKDYLRSQVINNFVINLVLNGLIAYFSFRRRENVPSVEMSVDALITVFILAFLVSWIALIVLRGELAKDKVQTQGWKPRQGAWMRLPSNAALRALILTAAFVVVFGGLLLAGSFTLFTPGGVNGMAYFVIKAFYAGICAALAAAVAILTMVNENAQSSIH